MAQLDPTANYGQKHYHNLKWGIWELVDGYELRAQSLGGNCRRLKGQRLESSRLPLLTMGNIWIHPDATERTLFRHPSLYGTREWYYWDNPQLPHLLYKGAWNPNGYKNWMRIVAGSTATRATKPRQGQTGSARINRQLSQLTAGKITNWRDILGPTRPLEPRSRKVLLCPPSDGVFQHYYSITTTEWIRDRSQTLQRMGFEPVLRPKPSRQARETGNKLCEQLAGEDYYATLSIHSVSGVESTLAGTPAIAEGRHACGPMATSWDTFCRLGEVLVPEQDVIDSWMERLLMDTYHKTEAYDGSWQSKTHY